MSTASYKDSGVDIEKGVRFARGIQGLMQRTFDERVICNEGGFGGLFSLDYRDSLFRHNYSHPVLVAGTFRLIKAVEGVTVLNDGVGGILID